MTDVVTVRKKNESFLYIDADPGIQMEIQEHFSFYVDGYKFMPKFKAKIWDGRVRLFNLVTKELPAGLLNQLLEFCNARSYDISYESTPYGIPGELNNISQEAVTEYIDSLSCSDKHGNVMNVRDFQYEAVYEALLNKRKVLLASTGSGKSLIAYCMIRWFLESDMNVILIVPTKALVLQMLKDFCDYSLVNGFNVDENTHIIMGGKDKKTSKSLTISTWQSLQRLPSEWFEKYDAVVVDECLHPDSVISTSTGDKKIKNIMVGDKVLTFNEDSKILEYNSVLDVHKNMINGVSEKRFKVETEDGKFLIVTGNHKVFTNVGWIRVDELTDDMMIAKL